jgi:hypothetical protein
MDALMRRSRRWLVLAGVVFAVTTFSSAQIRRGAIGGGGGGGWVLLGTSHVDGNNDHDKISCHGKDAYRALKVRVTGGAVQFERINIEYGNHTKRTIPFGFTIQSGGSRTADLPGDTRDLTYIEFYYRKGSWSNKPEVQLYGRP